MDESELDKTEEATPFKLQRAREKGAIARGIDLGFFATLVALLGYAWIAGAGAVFALGRASGATFSYAGDALGSQSALLAITGALFSSAIWPLIVLGGSVFAIVLLFEFLQVGPVFSAHPLKPDFTRINPAKGLKRLFSFRMLVEAFKSVIKFAIYGTIAWLVIEAALESRTPSLTTGARLFEALGATGFRLLLFSALAALFIAALDQIYSRRDFAKRMRMSRREAKREHRDREGDPRFKQKRKEFHQEFVKMARSLRNSGGSDVILTNPTHYAVALRYDPETMAAPQIVSRGAGKLAERIRTIGFQHGVVIVRDPALARALYRTRIVEGEIPEAHYQAVADIYRHYDLTGRKAA